jgi:D-glycero-D-manno-heptose 1,7-bisphosphate phosphatase
MNFDHALFLDRDGTLIKDCNGILTESKIEFEDGLEDFINHALKTRFKIIMVTNQTAVSKGLMTYSEMDRINNIVIKKMEKLLGSKIFNAVFICPFHPDAQIKEFRYDSEDRKPKPGMLIKAKKKFNISFNKSIMIGDRISDVVAGNIVGCKTVIKINEFSSLRIIKTNLKYSNEMIKPDYTVNHLKEIIPIMDTIL